MVFGFTTSYPRIGTWVSYCACHGGLAIHDGLFVENTWNFSNIQIPLVVWEGEEQRLSTVLSQCETPIDFFLLFWPTNVFKRLSVMTNIYVIQELERGGKKGGVNWVQLTMPKLKVFSGVLIFIVVKNIPHT